MDYIKEHGYRITIPKLAVASVTLLLFAWVAPVEQLNFLKSVSFQSLTFAFWLSVIGLSFIVEGFASRPEAKRGSSRIGAYFILGLGFLCFLFSVISILLGVDVLLENHDLRLFTTVLFGFGTIMYWVIVLPEIVHRKMFVKWLGA